MRYIKQAVLTSSDKNDYERLQNFIHELNTHSMYRPIVESMIAMPGFVKKEYTMRDDKEGQTFISLIEFDSLEGWTAYQNDESVSSLWDYLEIMAEHAGINFSLSERQED
jgi:hypothetical protein